MDKITLKRTLWDATDVDTSITMHWVASENEYGRFIASAKVTILSKSAVNIIFEVSPNGYDWVEQTTWIKDGLLHVTLPCVHKELYTRLRVSGKAKNVEETLAEIDWIEVKGKSLR